MNIFAYPVDASLFRPNGPPLRHPTRRRVNESTRRKTSYGHRKNEDGGNGTASQSTRTRSRSHCAEAPCIEGSAFLEECEDPVATATPHCDMHGRKSPMGCSERSFSPSCLPQGRGNGGVSCRVVPVLRDRSTDPLRLLQEELETRTRSGSGSTIGSGMEDRADLAVLEISESPHTVYGRF